MKSILPFTFNPGSSEFETAHLEYSAYSDGQIVKWNAIGINIQIPIEKDTIEAIDGSKIEMALPPNFGKIEKANGGNVKFYGLSGVSIGQYHEFYTSSLENYEGFKFSNIEVTFGEATPIFAFLFQGEHREKYFGAWEYITTTRIYGVNSDKLEAIFANAAILYHQIHGELPRIIEMDSSFYYEEENYKKPTVKQKPPAIGDVDPMRFYYHGLLQNDHASACIYFYRSLEYYAFLENQKKLAYIRHDSLVSDLDFPKLILDILSKDEKGPIIKLVASIATSNIIKEAFDLKLIKEKTGQILGESIYGFRNSIVHGKGTFGQDLQSTSIIIDEKRVLYWRKILQSVAWTATTLYGTKII
jgi:hypothetical protein